MALPKLPARTPAYLEQYARTVHAAYRYERIQREIADEQGRVQYLDSMIGQERQTLAALQQVFRAEDLDAAQAANALKGLAGAQRGAAAAKTATKAEQQALTSAFAKGAAAGRQATEALLADATPEKGQAILNAAKAIAGDKYTPDLAAHLNQYKAQYATRKAPSGVAAREGLEQAFFASPSGIRGGFEGLEVVERRKLTAAELEKGGLKADAEALRQSGYATQQDALEAALEQVRLTGQPAALEDTYARDIYLEARNKGAYTNAERADYEQEVLDSRRRLSQLETERQRIAGAYEDPAQEAIKRELIARGIKFYDGDDAWRNKYVQYQNTPLYDTLLAADRLVDAAKRDGKPLAPSTKAQNMVTALSMQYERTGTQFDINTLRAQLEKAKDLTPKDINDALGFIVAYRELGGDKQDPENLAFLKRQDELAQQRADRAVKQAAAKEAEVDRARQVTRQLEAEQVQAVSELRTEQAKVNLPGQEYARLRAMGMSAEEARAKAMQVVVPAQTSEAAGKVLMEPDLLMERQRRIEAARQAAAPAPAPAPEEITMRGGTVTVEAATAASAPAPAPPRGGSKGGGKGGSKGGGSKGGDATPAPTDGRSSADVLADDDDDFELRGSATPAPKPKRTKVVKDPATGKYVEVPE